MSGGGDLGTKEDAETGPISGWEIEHAHATTRGLPSHAKGAEH